MTAATVHHGDCRAIMPTLPAASVNIVLTDPPYSSGGMYRSDRSSQVHTKYVQTDSASGHNLMPFDGDNRDQRAYLTWTDLWMREAFRLLTPGGIIGAFTDWRQLPTMTDALQCAGFVWRGIVVWHKPAGRVAQNKWGNVCEYVVWGTKGQRPVNPTDAAHPGFYSAMPPNFRDREHITQKPVEVLQGLLKIEPAGAVVLDPFTGSGSTGVAAALNKQTFIGIEQDPYWCDTARRRIAGIGKQSDADQMTLDTHGGLAEEFTA